MEDNPNKEIIRTDLKLLELIAILPSLSCINQKYQQNLIMKRFLTIKP